MGSKLDNKLEEEIPPDLENDLYYRDLVSSRKKLELTATEDGLKVFNLRIREYEKKFGKEHKNSYSAKL